MKVGQDVDEEVRKVFVVGNCSALLSAAAGRVSRGFPRLMFSVNPGLVCLVCMQE